ncbi:MAG: transglutaminase family protein, partial [Pseudomonas putida]
MKPRQACLACLEREPVALLEAALWIAAEHDRSVEPAASLAMLHDLQREISANLPMLPLCELAQPLLRQLNALGFQQDEYHPLRPQAAMMDKVLQRRRGQPLTLAILALELAQRLSIPL